MSKVNYNISRYNIIHLMLKREERKRKKEKKREKEDENKR